jgi:hypothetical protein
MKKTSACKGIAIAVLMGLFLARTVSAQDFQQQEYGYDENTAGETSGSGVPPSVNTAPAGSSAGETANSGVPPSANTAPAAVPAQENTAADGGSARGVKAAQEAPASPFKWGGWGRAIWAPLIVQGGNVYDEEDGSQKTDGEGVPKYENNAWIGSGPGDQDIGAAIGVRMTGVNASQTIGMELLLGVDVGSLTSHNVVFANDNTANAWAKPFGNELVTVRGGLFQVSDLQGKIGGVNENFGVSGTRGGSEDDIFNNFNSGGRFGFHLKIVPFTGFQIHSAFSVNDSAMLSYNKNDRAVAWEEVFKAAQYGMGYTIQNIGFVRVQYIGGSYGKSSLASFLSSSKRWDQFQAAFQLLAVENLNVDLGVKIPIKIDGDSKVTVNNAVTVNDKDQALFDDDFYQAPVTARIGAQYTFDKLGLNDLGLHLGIKFGFGEKLEYTRAATETWEGPLTFGFDLEPSYKFGNSKIVGNISLAVKGKSTTTEGDISTENIDDTTGLGLGISFHRSFGGGNCSVGISANFPVGGEGYSDVSKGLAKAQAFKVMIPITITYDL